MQEISEIKAPVFALAIKSYKNEIVDVSIVGNRATLTGRLVPVFKLDEQGITRLYW